MSTLVLLATWDLMSLPGPSTFAVERSCQKIASLRKIHRVSLTITNRGRHDFLVWVRDDRPQEFRANPDEFMLRLPARSRATVHYELKASRRGAFELQHVYLRVRSRWGFWQRYLEYPGRVRDQRLSRHEATVRVRRAGPHQPAEPDGRAADAADRPGQRIRTAARLHARRQLQTHRLADHGPAQQADRQGLSDQPEPAADLPGRLRPHDDQRGSRA